MSPFSCNRSLLFVALLQLQVTTFAAAECTGFFCPENPYTRHNNEETEEEPCIGFGCNEEDSQEEEPSSNSMLGECTMVSLEMDTDSRPEDTTFELVCNDIHLWQYPSDQLLQRGAYDKLSVDSCVYMRDDSCCEFVIKDQGRDGLMAGDYAALSLKVDGEEILSYNTMDSPPFESLTRTFGSACRDAVVPVEETKKDEPIESCDGEDETLARFEITLDDKPEETSWYLICDDRISGNLLTLWNRPRGTLSTPTEAIVETACIAPTSTCAFSIVDSAGDGLDFGGYSLTFGSNLIDLYDTEPFDEKSYCIGRLCAENLQNAAEKTLASTLITDYSHEQLEKMGEAVGNAVDALVFDSKEEVKDEVSEIAQKIFGDDDESSSSDDTDSDNDDDLSDSDDEPGSSNQNRRPDSHFISEGSGSGVSLEAWAYAVLGVAALMGAILLFAACALDRATPPGQSSSDAARDALSPSKSGESDDASTFLGDEEEPAPV
ncbi:expressed unknown protein [Seminavis robusta]|uniref:Transmembrane protein n=1 Tax=Seminavis robusta TaxID=568900 RepID=A0A9N8EPX0_9STRA|nr:expressed unknown protein [Seminavis robusta]|eukprot:Sro1403_g269680.1 n/a (491) ;mRNA; f:15051-16523